MQVSEHTQTALLMKILSANIALGNALVNRSEQSNIVRRWLELQQSINFMFDSKTSLSESFVFSYVSTSFEYISISFVLALTATYFLSVASCLSRGVFGYCF